jgi:hypothetical protein
MFCWFWVMVKNNFEGVMIPDGMLKTVELIG